MPWDRKIYPPTWRAFSIGIRRERARDRCECAGECGGEHGARCPARNREQIPGARTGALVVLTVAHLWKHGCDHPHTAPCAEDAHVKAMCQACHLKYDRDQHLESARRTRERKAEA